MTFGIGLVLVILLLAAVLLGRAGSGFAAALFLLAAAGLFVMTPMGDGIPEWIAGVFSSADEATTSTVQQGGGE